MPKIGGTCDSIITTLVLRQDTGHENEHINLVKRQETIMTKNNITVDISEYIMDNGDAQGSIQATTYHLQFNLRHKA